MLQFIRPPVDNGEPLGSMDDFLQLDDIYWGPGCYEHRGQSYGQLVEPVEFPISCPPCGAEEDADEDEDGCREDEGEAEGAEQEVESGVLHHHRVPRSCYILRLSS